MQLAVIKCHPIFAAVITLHLAMSLNPSARCKLCVNEGNPCDSRLISATHTAENCHFPVHLPSKLNPHQNTTVCLSGPKTGDDPAALCTTLYVQTYSES